MNKKIIIGLGTSILLASSLYAFGCQGEKGQGSNYKNNHHKMMKKARHHKKNDRILKMVKMLDLEDEQKVKIKQIIQNSRKDFVNPYDAFSDSSFDKKQFIKLSNERKEAKVEKKAELISKIYNVLNSTQKKELKTIIDAKKIMMKKMIQKGDCNGKNCNGRG